MEIDKKMIDAAMTGAVESLRDSLVAELSRAIEWDVKAAATAQVAGHITEWITANVIPEVDAILFKNKDILINRITDSLLETMSAELSAAIKEGLKGKFENSWDRKKIFSALIG